MFRILITVLALLLIIFIMSKKTRFFLVTPQFAFVVSFIPSLLMLVLFVDKWDVALDDRTMLLIISGAVVFTAVSFITSYFTQRYRLVIRSSASQYAHPEGFNDHLIENYKLIIFILMGLIGVAAYLKYVSSFTGQISLSSFKQVLSNYRDAYNESSLDMPTLVTVTSMMATCIADYCVYYYFKNRKQLKGYGIKKLLLCLCCVPGIMIPLFSGARGGLINFGLFVFAAAFINSIKEVKIQRKTMRIAVILAIVAVATLRLGGIYMGRSIKESAIDYIGMYLPAPIRNLDYIIRTESIGLFTGFGDSANRTFSKLLNYLSFRFGLTINAATGRKTLMVNGHYTGNMYTVYYNLLHDAGFIGALLLLAVSAFLCQLFFVAIKKKIEGKEKGYTGAIAYTLIYSYLFLSFFNENFFYNVFTNYFLRQVIFFALIDWFVRKVRAQARTKVPAV